MKKTRALFLVAFCATRCSAFYQPEQGRWMSREPLGEAFGPNLYTQVGNDPANRLDVNGLYAFDMHYYVAYVALRSSGMSRDDAWQIAYWSATPDIDPRHNAIGRGGDAALYGTRSEAGNVQGLLHQLNGLKGDDIKKMRCCLKALYNNSTDPVVKGYALHALGDTYGHLVLETKRMWPFFSGGTLNELYSPPQGHFFDGTLADRVSFRVGLAEAYVADLFVTVGGQAQDLAQIRQDMTRTIYAPNTSTEAATANWHKREYGDLPGYAQDWEPGVKEQPLVSPRTVHNMTDRKFQNNFVLPLLKCLEGFGVKL
jgi:hypothetical protein